MKKFFALAAVAMLTASSASAHVPEGMIFGAWNWPTTPDQYGLNDLVYRIGYTDPRPKGDILWVCEIASTFYEIVKSPPLIIQSSHTYPGGAKNVRSKKIPHHSHVWRTRIR